jgi:Tfp pilus assembly protein PilO
MKSIYQKYLIKVALIWAGCFVPLFILHMVMLSPQKSLKRGLEKQLAEKEQLYNSAFRLSQKEAKIQLSKEIEELQDQLQNFVIDFEDSANLTFDISQIANEKKVGSFSIKTKEDRSDSKLPDCEHLSEDDIEIRFTTGNFNQFATFLNALERHRPVVFVDKFTISQSTQNEEGHKVNMSLSVFVKKRRDS